jgi:8-oxo-dGTP pyrophosphatase MutT (NUDIX family)
MGEKSRFSDVTVPILKQLPISIKADHKSDVRTQFAALCYRTKNDKVEVLLITTRQSGRWIVPKGWPMDGKTPAECALQEAWEEAGVIGKSRDRCLGIFSFKKIVSLENTFPCVGMIYPVRVTSLKTNFPEAGQRRRKWFSQKKAALRISEPELARIVKDFDPKRFR